jgi:hypothetical protein
VEAGNESGIGQSTVQGKKNKNKRQTIQLNIGELVVTRLNYWLKLIKIS